MRRLFRKIVNCSLNSFQAYSSAITKPKRFYKTVDVCKVEQLNQNDDVPKFVFQIRLDKRILKTQAGNTLQVILI